MIRCSSMHCNVQAVPRKQTILRSLNNCTTSDDRAIYRNKPPMIFTPLSTVLYCLYHVKWTEYFSTFVRCSYHDSQPSTIAFQRIGLVLLCIDKWSYLTNKAKNAPQCNPQMHTVQEVIFVLIESQNVMFIGWLWRPLLSHNHPITASYFQDSLRWCCTVLIFTLCY